MKLLEMVQPIEPELYMPLTVPDVFVVPFVNFDMVLSEIVIAPTLILKIPYTPDRAVEVALRLLVVPASVLPMILLIWGIRSSPVNID
jgi:hypothetical protein